MVMYYITALYTARGSHCALTLVNFTQYSTDLSLVWWDPSPSILSNSLRLDRPLLLKLQSRCRGYLYHLM